jgi:uncharacterized protein YndB with AHSA1/START domain
VKRPAETERARIAFKLERRFEKSRDVVFRAWTDPEILKLWWCPTGWTLAEIEVDLRVGGEYRIGMRRNTGGLTVYVKGVFLEVNSPEALVYTWTWENAFDGMPQTRVTVRFFSKGEATIVVLEHDGLPEISVCLRHRSGWLAALERIQKIL